MRSLWLVALVLITNYCVESKLWNPSTDPLPPLQPKEVGIQTYNFQRYHLVSNGEIVLDVEIPGYQFYSYSNLIVQSVTAGEANNQPTIQIAYDNYLNPSLASSSLLAHYNTQTCTDGAIEGDSPYMGYNYYQTFILELYNAGLPIYFNYTTLPDYGVCLQYTATPPFPSNDDKEPRDITYTLTFQESTGYLLIYALSGTEYCCPGPNFYCPNNGLCNDGTFPQLTYANTTQTNVKYQLFTNTSWPAGFFGPYCPFPSSSSDGGNNRLSLGSILAIVFGILFGISCLIIAYLLRFNNKQPLLKPSDPNSSLNI